MQVLYIDYEYYYLPDGMDSVKDFAEFANRSDRPRFIALIRLETENCCAPFFVKEDVKEVYMNIDRIEHFSAAEATVLPRAEYDRRLAEVVKYKCADCENYEEDNEGDDLDGHRFKLSLDGECFSYKKRREN